MDETMEKYLVKFGYLNTQSNSGIHSFRAEKYFRNAVKNFQVILSQKIFIMLINKNI